MNKVIIFKTSQEYFDSLEKEFHDELNCCVSKSKLKSVIQSFDNDLWFIKNDGNTECNFNNFTIADNLIEQSQKLINALTNNRNYYIDKQLFLTLLSKNITLPQMNIDKIYLKWVNLINAIYDDVLFKIEQNVQKRLNELKATNNPEFVVFFNNRNEKLATISKDGIFSFKVESNDENTKEFLKAAQTLGIEIKQINYFEV